MALLGRKKPILLGIEISSTTIKLLELARVAGVYRVEIYAVEPLPPNAVVEKNITDVELVGEAVGRAVKKSGTRTKTAACAVPGSAAITKVISMPADLSEDEMESQIQLEAEMVRGKMIEFYGKIAYSRRKLEMSFRSAKSVPAIVVV